MSQKSPCLDKSWCCGMTPRCHRSTRGRHNLATERSSIGLAQSAPSLRNLARSSHFGWHPPKQPGDKETPMLHLPWICSHMMSHAIEDIEGPSHVILGFQNPGALMGPCEKPYVFLFRSGAAALFTHFEKSPVLG